MGKLLSIINLIILNLIWFSILLPQSYGHEKIESKCYDRYSNEIEGLKCFVTPMFSSYNQKVLLIGLGSLIFIIYSIFLWRD